MGTLWYRSASPRRSQTLRAEFHDRFAQALRDGADQARLQQSGLHPLTDDLATAIIGAVYELMLRALQEGEIDPRRIADTATELIAAVLAAPSENA